MIESKLVYWKKPVALAWGEYDNGRPALRLLAADGEPVAVASVNFPDHPIQDGCMAVKDWSENAGMVETLAAAGVIVGEPVDFIASGYVVAPVYRINKEAA